MKTLKSDRKKIHVSSLHRPCLSDSSGAVLLTVVVIIIIIGLTGIAIYSLTTTSTFTQLHAQNATKAHYIAESGARILAAEYNNAAGNKNDALENLHGTTLTLPDNAGQFDARIYPYWFYAASYYSAEDTSISVKIPGGIPLQNPEDPDAARMPIPSSGKLKVKGKTQLATIVSKSPTSPGDGDTITFGLNPGFPYDIQADEELFLAYTDAATDSQSVSEDGSLDLPGNNPVAQMLSPANGSFRIYNETNSKMDYTYLKRWPKVIDPSNPPALITLSGIHDQSDANPSEWPFSVGSDVEMYLGKNLAVLSDSSFGQGAMAARKTVGAYTDVGLDGGFSTGKDTISFDEDIADFVPTMNDPGGSGNPDPIEVHTTEKTIELGGGLGGGYGSVWYKGYSDIANCIEGDCLLGRGFRAYFELLFDNQDWHSESKSFGDGFTFSILSSDNYADDDTGAGGEYMGYAGAGLSSDGLQPPKIGLEFDTYPNTGAGDVCDSDSRRDDTPVANHAALVYWGEEAIGSFDAISTSNNLSDGGGYLRIGSATPSNGSDEDWSSPAGTISFWFMRDSTRSSDRLWGQGSNFEMRFSFSGSNLVLDWGENGSATINNHPFTVADKWYFMAIAWNQQVGVDHLRVYYAHETLPLTPLYSDNNWEGDVDSVGITENLFMNSSGGSPPGNRNYIVNGKIAEVRYFDTERVYGAISGDYNTRLSGSESNLQAYFPLQADLVDLGPNNITVTAVGTTGWSGESVSYFDCSMGEAARATYDDNRHGDGGDTTPMNSLNTNSGNGYDGYHQVTGSSPNWLEDGETHQVRMELIRPLSPAEDGEDDGFYDYQMKVWIDCDGCSTEEQTQFLNLRATFTPVLPQIEKTVQQSSSLKLEESIHNELKRILFGFTEGTGGATQNITLSNFEIYFLRQYPVSDLATW